MKIKESLDQSKFPTRHLKDAGIEYIRKMEEMIKLNDNEGFIALIRELCDKTIWLSVTTRDLYYWIEVLNKVDLLLESTLNQVKALNDGTEKWEDDEYQSKLSKHSEDLKMLFTFTNYLLKDSGSRTIYNSVDRIIETMHIIDDLDLLYLCLETIYTLIKKSCLTGKFTKAHETKENGLLKLMFMLSSGFNFLSDEKLELVDSLNIQRVLRDNEIKLQRFQKIKKGNKEIPSLSYFKVPYDDLSQIPIDNGCRPTSRNLAVQIEKNHSLGHNLVDPLAMKILFAQKLMDKRNQDKNLSLINGIMLKAKSVFIHLSSAEEDPTLTLKFIKEFPFNNFIPDLLNYCTVEAPSQLHCDAIEILHSYLCAAIMHSEAINIYKQSVNIIMQALGVVNMNSRPLHKILSDCASLRLRSDTNDNEEISAFDTESFSLESNAKFIPHATAEDPNFIDIFLDLVLMFVTNYKSTPRSIVNELLNILDAQPEHGYYIFKLSQVSKATRILYSIMRNNFEEFHTVERTIQRLNCEIKIIKESKDKGATQLSEWKYAQNEGEVVHKSSRQELIRVLFRLLNSSIFKNDPNQGNFNPNFVSNSKKILDSKLFDTWLELFEENKNENSDTHDVVFVSAMHLMALVLNDLPAQISKAWDTFLPGLLKSLEERVPNYNNFYLSMLKLVSAVTVHDKGKEWFRQSKLIEKMLIVPIEPDYGFNFINCERTYEYSTFLRDLLRNDEEICKRALDQLFKNIDYLSERCIVYTKQYLSLSVEERTDLYDHKKEICSSRRNITDQIDTFFNLLSYIITDMSGGFQHASVEQKIWTPEMFRKIFEIFNIPLIGDILAKDNIIYRDVFKTFIHEHPRLFDDVHQNLIGTLDKIETLIGPLKDAGHFISESGSNEASGTLTEITSENIRSLEHTYTNNERLEFLYCLVKNYCSIIKSGYKKIDGFLDLKIDSTLNRLSYLRKAIILGGSELYGRRLRDDYEANKEDIAKFDLDLETKDTKFTKDDYTKKYSKISDWNYANTNFSGVLEFDEKTRTNVEREAEVWQSEIFKLIQLCWKRKIANETTSKAKKNVKSIVDAVIHMTELFSSSELDKISKQFEEKAIDSYALMADLVKFNQAVEECTKLFSSDSPYITHFYMNWGFRNLFSLYHWLRKITPEFEKLEDKRVLFSKHLQLLWSNLGDLLATIIEMKFSKEAREIYALVTEKHTSESQFISSLWYHICDEIFKQEDIITFFLNHSKFFLECLIDIMKLLINEEETFKNPVQRDNRANRFAGRYGVRGMFGDVPRPAPMEFDDATIESLMTLGFTRTRVIEALNRSQGNMDLSAEYLLSLPPEVISSDFTTEANEKNKKDKNASKDIKMVEEEDDWMDVDNSEIYVKTADELLQAIKGWLEALYTWILKGFNSSLTDVDVENITQFILKYISKEEDVINLMNTLITTLNNMFKYFKDPEPAKDNSELISERKSCLKKASTLSQIISHLHKYYIKNVDFIESLIKFWTDFFVEYSEQPIKFLLLDETNTPKDLADLERLKTEPEIFKDIIDNWMNIIIASYGFYKLSVFDEEKLKQETEMFKKIEEVKEELKDNKNKSDSKEESTNNKPIENYFKDMGALEDIKVDEDPKIYTKNLETHLDNWKEKFSEDHFMHIVLLMISHAHDNFDECFTQKSFNKFLFLLLKLLDEPKNIDIFQNEKGFMKLLNLKSKKRKIVDNSKSYFHNIVFKLIEDENTIYSITENIIKKSLFFKHDEEFSKEMKEKAKEAMPKKKHKVGKAESVKVKEKIKEGEAETEARPQEVLLEKANEEEKQPLADQKSMKRSGSSDAVGTKIHSKSKSIIKKSDISFNTFKNCSRVRLTSFMNQLNFIQSRSTKVFVKACANLCEIEVVKEYGADLKVKTETKYIKLKDSVLKDYIAKTAKESSVDLKSLQIDKKDISQSCSPPITMMKSGSKTARVKEHSTSSSTNLKDSLLISSLKNTQNFFEKSSKRIILVILEKIVDKFCLGNLENWIETPKDSDFESQCIFSYSTLLIILNKIIKTYPSTASLITLFKSKKLKHFTSFVDFLVRKIYPIGFIRWVKKDPEDKSELKKLEELWQKSFIKDSKPDSVTTKDEIFYKVCWDRNTEWESIIADNMRTLIDFNVFMSNQEKKVKIEIKKHLISGLLEKTMKISSSNSLKNIAGLCTSLILIRKLMSPSESLNPLCYNKENVIHTIKELKTNNHIFKILSDLMKSINPISAEAEIIDAILIPLIERMTYSQEDAEKKVSESSPSVNEQEMVDENDLDQVELDIEIEIQEDGEGDDQDRDEPEDEEDEDEVEVEDEEEDDMGEPFVEENATQSDNLSLDDMIEELEYGDEDEPESNSEDNDHDDIEEESEGDHEMDEDNENDYIDEDDISIDSEGGFQAVDREGLNPNLMGLVEDPEAEGEDYQNEGQDDQEENDPLNFNVIEIDENQIDRPNFFARPGVGDLGQFSEDIDLIEQDIGDMGFHQILNFLHRRDRRPPMGLVNPFNRGPRRNYDLNFGFGQRRVADMNARGGLDSLYNIERSANDADFWQNNINIHASQNNRNRAHRPSDDYRDPGDAISNLISRDINEIRERLENQVLNRGRRDRDRNEIVSTNNPFDIIRKLTNSYNEINESHIEASCEVKITEKKPTKEEIEKEQEKDAKSQEKSDASMSKSKNDLNENEIVEGLDNLEIRRSDEPSEPIQQDSQVFGPSEPEQPARRNSTEPIDLPPNEEVKNEQIDMNIDTEQNSSQMQVDEHKSEDEKQEDQNIATPLVQEPSQNVVAEPALVQSFSEAYSRVNEIINSFGITKEQVESTGIDLTILEWLPEDELVIILSDLAANIGEMNEDNNEVQNNESEEVQPLIEPSDNVNAQSSPRIIPQPENNARNEPNADQPERANIASSENPSEQDSLTSMMQNLLNMPSQNIAEPFMQALNSSNAPQPNANDLQQMFGSLEATLQSMNMNLNQPRPGGRINVPPPNPFAGGMNMPNANANLGTFPILPNMMAPPVPHAPAQNVNAAPVLPEGIDADFFNSLPEEYKQELLNNENLLRRNMGQELLPTPAPAGQPEQMDTASFLATITDESLRREIMIGMDEPTIATLPPRVQAEARRYQREIVRRQYRRDARDNPERLFREMMNRDNDRAREREREDRKKSQIDDKADNFLDIIRRREERYVKNNDDVGSVTISTVFNDDKNLKNMMKIIIIESQRKDPIKFERLIKPYENLCKHNVIRSKLHQVLMLMLNHYKTFAGIVQYSYIKKNQIQIDNLFPPVFMLSEDGQMMEEIQYSKIASLIFRIFSYEASKYSSTNADLIKSFFMKDSKKSNNQVQSWFSYFEKDKNQFDFIQDSPFLCLLKFILTEDFHTNQNDMAQMLKLASDLLRRYLKPIKDKVITVDNDTLSVLFKLITLKVDQEFIKQICLLFYNIWLIDHEQIFKEIKEALRAAIPDVKDQITEEIKNLKSDNMEVEPKEESNTVKGFKEALMKHGQDDEEEKIVTTTSNVRSNQSYANRSSGIFYNPDEGRRRILSVTQTEIKEKSLQLVGGNKLERLLKVFKILLHQFSKHSRSNSLSEEQREKGKQLKEKGMDLIDIKELKDLFETFSDYLMIIPENEINDIVKMVSMSMFLCYQEDFKRIDQKVFNEDFNKPHIVMEEEKEIKEKKTPSFVNEEYLKEDRVAFFINLCTKHNKMFNTMIRQNQYLIRDSLKHVVFVVPHLLDFDNKHHFFRQELKKIKRLSHHESIRIAVNRNRMFRIFEDSYEQMHHLSPDEWKGKIEVTFSEERGYDAGGLTREWFTEIAKQMLNPNLGMFKLSDSGSTYYPNPKSYIQGDHTAYLKFIGRIVGKSLLEEQYIECTFVKALYKIIRGAPLTWHDVEDYDNDYYKNLKWTMENDAEVLQQSFCESMDFFGKMKVFDLIPNGRNIPVTNENKQEYVQKVSFFKLYTSIKEQIDAFLQGFYELIPRKLISIFDHGELELLISGLPTIDIDDMRANTDYQGYTETSPVIQWFWEVLNELSNPERAEFLQFVTGSSKVPIEGFIALQGMRGPQKFNIHKAYVEDYNRLPVAHTCFNQLDLPEYPSKELLRERLMLAFREGKGSFQLV